MWQEKCPMNIPKKGKKLAPSFNMPRCVWLKGVWWQRGVWLLNKSKYISCSCCNICGMKYFLFRSRMSWWRFIIYLPISIGFKHVKLMATFIDLTAVRKNPGLVKIPVLFSNNHKASFTCQKHRQYTPWVLRVLTVTMLIPTRWPGFQYRVAEVATCVNHRQMHWINTLKLT